MNEAYIRNKRKVATSTPPTERSPARDATYFRIAPSDEFYSQRKKKFYQDRVQERKQAVELRITLWEKGKADWIWRTSQLVKIQLWECESLRKQVLSKNIFGVSLGEDKGQTLQKKPSIFYSTLRSMSSTL